MLKDGQKGVILQRDKETYAIAPHIPCGLVTPELLERIAAVARKYAPAALKITARKARKGEKRGRIYFTVFLGLPCPLISIRLLIFCSISSTN
jgi:hypothetical protein